MVHYFQLFQLIHEFGFFYETPWPLLHLNILATEILFLGIIALHFSAYVINTLRLDHNFESVKHTPEKIKSKQNKMKSCFDVKAPLRLSTGK
jgi:hypothetical protein